MNKMKKNIITIFIAVILFIAITVGINKIGVNLGIDLEVKCVDNVTVADVYVKWYFGEPKNIKFSENLAANNKIVLDENNQPLRCTSN